MQGSAQKVPYLTQKKLIYKIIDTEEENSKLSEIFYKISDEYNAEIEGKVKKLLLINETIEINRFIDSLIQ